ncbi:hypothetical protein JS533_008720 [Bifidobacterium amazonense]|uniref:Uncharacterized protein n=1 Tax=Bifidobacterium amazonense TaxID=2809027 RepID=A0ABS9VW55_9BIFI|nr:hypothetical protein [Bifidobacterium amazonense]
MPGLHATHRYDDIIDAVYHPSARHPAMPRANRAAQFMPFSALTGYDEVLLANLKAMQDRIAAEDTAGDQDFGA